MGTTRRSSTATMNSSLLLLALVLLSCFHCYPAARHGRPLLTGAVAVVGDSIHSGSKTTNAISGALVAVRCHDGNGRTVSEAPELCGEKGIFFPPIPLVPEPPNIGGVPIPPNPITPAPPSLVPPLLPTPSPPSILPPLVPQPPPSSIIPPLLPPLLQSPPPPPPPPQLLPPVPVLPPLFPGVPPSLASKNLRLPGATTTP